MSDTNESAKVRMFCTEMQKRRAAALLNIPPVRFDLTTPYPTYTKMQLDMRRKCEILKYKSTTQSSQTNSLTKNQMYSKLANNSSSISQLRIANCPRNVVTEANTPSLTTSCNVPGLPMVLQLDPQIPLYSYMKQ
jgi:hypothetical protein